TRRRGRLCAGLLGYTQGHHCRQRADIQGSRQGRGRKSIVHVGPAQFIGPVLSARDAHFLHSLSSLRASGAVEIGGWCRTWIQKLSTHHWCGDAAAALPLSARWPKSAISFASPGLCLSSSKKKCGLWSHGPVWKSARRAAWQLGTRRADCQVRSCESE